MLCKCGQDINTTGCGYSYRAYNERGEIIYEVCIHGIVVVDVRETIETDDDDTERLSD